MKILNLGCGTRTSSSPCVINIDWSIYLRIKRSVILNGLAPALLRGDRLVRYKSLPENIMVHNLARGIPFATNSVDVVYHSNMLEHLDKEIAEEFLSEALRVLKPGGIHRIVVPDFEMACKTYVSHIALAEVDPTEAAKHDSYIARIIEQSVRRDAAGTRLQKPIRRRLENIIIGNARRRGETHQWMYDRINLAALLRMTGYVEPRLMSFKTSLVEAWGSLGLDFDHTGIEFQPGSFYMEAKKPISSRSADPQ